jgi:hypothetical protein
MTDVTALAVEEPAAVHFTGITDKNIPRSGPRYAPDDSLPILADPKRYYTPRYQTITRDKIGRILSPILIVQGDQHPLNRFNREVLIPELQSAGKALEVPTYPGEPHCFAFGSPPRAAQAALKAFQDTDAFFRRHLNTQPKPIDPTLIAHLPLNANSGSTGANAGPQRIARECLGLDSGSGDRCTMGFQQAAVRSTEWVGDFSRLESTAWRWWT